MSPKDLAPSTADATPKDLAHAEKRAFPLGYVQTQDPKSMDRYYKGQFRVSLYTIHDVRHGKLRNTARRLAKLSLGVGVLFAGFCYRIHLSEEGTVVSSTNTGHFLRYLPLRQMSRWAGTVSEWEMPTAAISAYATLAQCDVTEAERPVDQYTTLQAFFTRKLKNFEAVRPISPAPLVSPADSTIFRIGELTSDESNEWVEQVKGYRYVLEEFTRFRPLPVAADKRRVFAVCYLAPGDYHRFHLPASGFWVTTCNHVIGTLLPVNSIAYKYIDELFCLNERVSLNGHWEHGYMSVTAVGAYNVGSVNLSLDNRAATNQPYQDVLWNDASSTRSHGITSYKEPISLGKKGDELGYFKLGSTVVVIADIPKDWQASANIGEKVKVGQALFAPQSL